MKTVVLRSFFVLTTFIACAQEKNDNPTLISSKMKTINSVPFLTRQNDFVYVDKTSLKPVIEQKFKTASLFTATGFAIVGNEKNESAVIDERGKIVLEFSEDVINVNVINGLTFYKKEIEYEKKMPSSKWDWNIMGSNIKKEQTYHKVEIGVLETKQVLLSEDGPYLEDEYSINFVSVDENHVFWNGSLYEIKKNHINKVEDNITELLEDKRFIKASNSSFRYMD